jgi:serine/threonine protein kinase
MAAVRIDQQNRNIPLPLAQLKRRASNAKTGSERHLAAYYLWESGLKLLASVAIVEYARQPVPDPELGEMLKNLAKPSIGQWWEFIRRLIPVLADRGDEPFQIARDLILGPTRDNLPRLAGMYCEVSKVLGEANAPDARTTVRLTELFHRMVQYRNKVFAHGGLRSSDFHERMASVFLGGLTEMLTCVDMLAGRRLIYVPEITLDEQGQPRIHRFELAGEEPRELPVWTVQERTLDRLPKPKRLYLDAGPAANDDQPNLDHWTSLHPLAVYDADLDEVLYLNGRCGKGKKRAGYLGYVSGNEQIELATDLTGLLARLLGGQVAETDIEAWAARSESNDPEPGFVQGEVAEPLRLGEFELLSRIGRGGMGVVYRAFQPSLGRQVAVKRLARPGDSQAATRFAREIRALGKVDHPHLVKVYCSGSAGEDWFYAMELVEGVDLGTLCSELAGSEVSAVDETQWIQALSTACQRARSQEEALGDGHTLPAMTTELQQPAAAQPTSSTSLSEGNPKNTSRSHIRRIVQLAKQVARAVDALHRAHVIHRDIKPGNIMVDPSGSRAVLLDLGLAQLADDIDGRVTRTRQFVGTLRYASPEQILSAGNLDYRTDIYSLGATLWELLTMRPLFGATDETPAPDLMLKIQSDDPEPPRRYNPRISADLEAIILKCLEKKRDKRYATAAELIDDLERWERDEPVRARKAGTMYRLAKGVRRHRTSLASVVGAMVLLVMLGLGFFGLSRHFELTHEHERLRLAVKGLLDDVDTPNVPAVLEQIRWTPETIRLLEEAYNHPENRNTRRQLHAALALVGRDAMYVDFLLEKLLTALSRDFPVIRRALEPHAPKLTARLGNALESDASPSSTRFRAAMALAAFTTTDSVSEPWRWQPHVNLVAEQLVEEIRANPNHAEALLAELTLLHEMLLPRLRLVFHEEDSPRRHVAARLLAKLYAECPEDLAELIGAARDNAQREYLVSAISHHGDQAVAILERELKSAPDDFRNAPTGFEQQYPQAGWIVHEDFALCHAMPMDDWIHAADRLRSYGYRPIRCRPYYTPAGVLVAAIWHPRLSRLDHRLRCEPRTNP